MNAIFLRAGDDLTGAAIEVWTSDFSWSGVARNNYLCAKDIGPIGAGEVKSVLCYTPLKVHLFDLQIHPDHSNLQNQQPCLSLHPGILKYKKRRNHLKT